MKCQKCGNSEACFHYSSNINGCATETHLCSECAAKSGYDVGQILKMERAFDGFFPIFGTSQVLIPMPGFNTAYPHNNRQIPGRAPHNAPAYRNYSTGAPATANPATADPEIDDGMKQIRMLNMQLHTAIENEEFEKAAELRDKIKELEQ